MTREFMGFNRPIEYIPVAVLFVEYVTLFPVVLGPRTKQITENKSYHIHPYSSHTLNSNIKWEYPSILMLPKIFPLKYDSRAPAPPRGRRGDSVPQRILQMFWPWFLFFCYEMGCYRCYMNLIFNTAIKAIKDWPRQVNNNDTVFGQDVSRLAHNPITCTESITTGEGSTQLSDCILFNICKLRV